MNKKRTIDVSVGLFIILSLLALVFMVVNVSGITSFASSKGYEVTADFNNIGGLKVRAPVTIAGVKIGEVTHIDLQAGDLIAKVTMRLQPDKPIPYDDISARILTEGLLGSNYISIVPGFDDKTSTHPYLQSGDLIQKTQEALVLENLIGQFLFNAKK